LQFSRFPSLLPLLAYGDLSFSPLNSNVFTRKCSPSFLPWAPMTTTTRKRLLFIAGKEVFVFLIDFLCHTFQSPAPFWMEDPQVNPRFLFFGQSGPLWSSLLIRDTSGVPPLLPYCVRRSFIYVPPPQVDVAKVSFSFSPTDPLLRRLLSLSFVSLDLFRLVSVMVFPLFEQRVLFRPSR